MKATSMFTRFKKRVAASGPATIVAVISLTVALCGGAFAATASKQKKAGGVVITKLNQISPSVRKQLQGAAGATGQPGAKGDTGAEGAKGDPGAKGNPGNNGEPGESVTVEEIEPEDPLFRCEELGGAEVRLESQELEEGVEVCNGEPGSSGSSDGTLSPGSAETGIYGMQTSAESGSFGIWAPISFPTPLGKDTTESLNFEDAVAETFPHVEYVSSLAEEEHCPGTYASPQALPGYLCIYQNPAIAAYNTTFIGAKRGPTGASGVLSSGTYLEFAPNEASELAVVAGSFAVTGCSATLLANKCP
jgi:Collagen triple helix repeat (20 copies)